jgi:glycosyltransferase involved in cell wall biosynthesis
MRLHILGVPHTKTTDEFTTCAFTMKVRNLCKMMHARGHEVFHYSAEGSNPDCTEHVSVVTADEWGALYKHPTTGFYDLSVDGKYAPFHAKWAINAKKAMLARMGPHEYGDIICMTWGGTQRTAADGVPQCQVESGIGYPHSWANYRVYESYAWMHMHLGRENIFGGGKWYWAVIPNAFDLEMFDFNSEPPAARGDELLYIGRLNNDKGVALACDITKQAGLKLLLVGQGNPEPFLHGNPHVRYLPPVGVAGRRRLMAETRAVICPTIYVEPFCGVHVEAMLSGTPVITTDWGVFPETVLHGVTGYRCRTMEQFVWAAKNVHKLEPLACRTWASSNFSLERVSLMYEEFFQQVLNLRHKHPNGGGFYLPDPQRNQLDWLRRRFPEEAAVERIDLDRKHVPTPDPGPETSEEEWHRAQQFERSWWGLDWAPHWDEELKKQQGYFRLMDMPSDFDFGDKTVLDVGCGPVSLLQRSKHGKSRGIDPLSISKETAKRYNDAGVEFLNIKAEDMPVDRVFDEVWMYNTLQHTEDPHAILRKITSMGRAVRIFEWIDIKEKYEGHPQLLSEQMFLDHFGGPEYDRVVWNVGNLRDFGGTATNRYIAIYAVRKTPLSVEAATGQAA